MRGDGLLAGKRDGGSWREPEAASEAKMSSTRSFSTDRSVEAATGELASEAQSADEPRWVCRREGRREGGGTESART